MNRAFIWSGKAVLTGSIHLTNSYRGIKWSHGGYLVVDGVAGMPPAPNLIGSDADNLVFKFGDEAAFFQVVR